MTPTYTTAPGDAFATAFAATNVIIIDEQPSDDGLIQTVAEPGVDGYGAPVWVLIRDYDDPLGPRYLMRAIPGENGEALIARCRAFLVALDALRLHAQPEPGDEASPLARQILAVREAAADLAQALATSDGVDVRVLPACRAYGYASADLAHAYNGLRRPRPDVAQLFAVVSRIPRLVQSAIRPACDARYEAAIRQALEPALQDIATAERMADDVEQAGREDLMDTAMARVRAAETRARTVMQDWQRPGALPALRRVLTERGRGYLLAV